MADQLVNKLTDRKLIASYLDHQFIISVIFILNVKSVCVFWQNSQAEDVTLGCRK